MERKVKPFASYMQNENKTKYEEIRMKYNK